MDTYCAINKAEWAIPWNSRVLQFKKGARPPRPLCLGWIEGRMDARSLPLPGKMEVVVVGSQLGGGCWFFLGCVWSAMSIGLNYGKGRPLLHRPVPSPTLQNVRHRQTDGRSELSNGKNIFDYSKISIWVEWRYIFIHFQSLSCGYIMRIKMKILKIIWKCNIW
jgi:hypothetical protein